MPMIPDREHRGPLKPGSGPMVPIGKMTRLRAVAEMFLTVAILIGAACLIAWWG